MTVWVNGEPRDLPVGAKLADAVAATGASPDRPGIAVAVDGEVVPRGEWGATPLEHGQRVEVVQAVQGG
jgi:sulfur carrier protein